MKNQLFQIVSFVILFVLSLASTFAQAPPDSVKYQFIVRDAAGIPLGNHDICVRLTILRGSSGGFPVYQETHNTTSNQFGLVNLSIGNGNVQVFGSIGAIDWGSNTYYVKTELDSTNACATFLLMGTEQFISVPYAFYSDSAATAGYADTANYVLNVTDDDWEIMPNGDMHNLNSGNVGIGTATPNNKLELITNSNNIFAASIVNQSNTGHGLEVRTASNGTEGLLMFTVLRGM